ncbi:hypothetical protein PRZ61_03015 [Halomonas pacifica]|uniref:hypothetical protein n=1 Tax=Bisbaumannia pacifica TaxID=77098 RepID=UPI00235A43ED|nr:hypothetical protein [Halomonas pacifica]MDC8802425.1 hypothetical protein [Halomonas pacifica]
MTLSVRNERITFDAGDWPAIQKTVNDALKAEGKWHRSRGKENVPAAIGFTVADKSRLTREKVS